MGMAACMATGSPSVPGGGGSPVDIGRAGRLAERSASSAANLSAAVDIETAGRDSTLGSSQANGPALRTSETVRDPPPDPNVKA